MMQEHRQQSTRGETTQCPSTQPFESFWNLKRWRFLQIFLNGLKTEEDLNAGS
jgi:hypothetical protein